MRSKGDGGGVKGRKTPTQAHVRSKGDRGGFKNRKTPMQAHVQISFIVEQELGQGNCCHSNDEVKKE